MYTTKAPTKSPINVPTEFPTKAPTKYPTKAPTRYPSKAPIKYPTGAPTTNPTKAQTKHPTKAPINSPVKVPTNVPSTIPMKSPTKAPKAPNKPTTATKVPTEPPRTMPTAAPTAGSARQPATISASAVAGDVAALGEAGMALGGNVAAIAQEGRLVLLAAGCRLNGIENEEDLPWSLHPTGLRLHAFALPVHSGCVVANLAIVACVALLHAAASRAVGVVADMKARGDKGRYARLYGEGFLRYPSVSMLLMAIAAQGVSYAAGRLLRLSARAGGTLLGASGALVVMLLPPAVLWTGRRCVTEGAVYKLDPETRRGLRYLVLGPGDWISVPRKRKAVERFGVGFRHARPGYYWFPSADLLLTQLMGLVAGMVGMSCAGCAARCVASAVTSGVLAALVVRCRPYARPASHGPTVLAHGLAAVAAVLLAAGYFSADCGTDSSALPGHEAAVALIIAAVLLLIVVGLLDLTYALWGLMEKRRGKLKVAVNSYLVDTIGTGPSGADATGAVPSGELLSGFRGTGWDISDDVWAGSFASVAGGSGALPFREFLAHEYFFWDAASGAAPRAGGPAVIITAEPGGASPPLEVRDTTKGKGGVAAPLESSVETLESATPLLRECAGDPPRRGPPSSVAQPGAAGVDREGFAAVQTAAQQLPRSPFIRRELQRMQDAQPSTSRPAAAGRAAGGAAGAMPVQGPAAGDLLRDPVAAPPLPLVPSVRPSCTFPPSGMVEYASATRTQPRSRTDVGLAVVPITPRLPAPALGMALLLGRTVLLPPSPRRAVSTRHNRPALRARSVISSVPDCARLDSGPTSPHTPTHAVPSRRRRRQGGNAAPSRPCSGRGRPWAGDSSLNTMTVVEEPTELCGIIVTVTPMTVTGMPQSPRQRNDGCGKCLSGKI